MQAGNERQTLDGEIAQKGRSDNIWQRHNNRRHEIPPMRQTAKIRQIKIHNIHPTRWTLLTDVLSYHSKHKPSIQDHAGLHWDIPQQDVNQGQAQSYLW